jgi:hypothetical protein
MNANKEKFLRNEFLTMSVLGALGRSKTYSDAASEEDKARFRNALHENLDEISKAYTSQIEEEKHLSNIRNLSDTLTSGFQHCLRNGRFRIGIAQKALNLYLKYLWCLDLIVMPPHCPFDSIIISHLPHCKGLIWTSIDTIEDYQILVQAARKKADGEPLPEWELKMWTNSVQSARGRVNVSLQILSAQQGKRSGPMNGWTATATRLHDDLKNAMKPYQGRELTTAKIANIAKSNPSLAQDAQLIQPSDHCSNHTNNGACTCALTDRAIFDRLRRGLYYVRNAA